MPCGGMHAPAHVVLCKFVRHALETRQHAAVQVLEPWGEVTMRAAQGLNHLEVEWTVGPLPFKDGFGREVAVK